MLTITRVKPNMCDSYSTTPALEPISPWAKATQYSQSNYGHDPATVRSPLFTPFDSASSSVDNHTNPSSIERYSNWGIPSLKEKCYSSDTSLRNSSRPDKKSLTRVMKFDTHSRSKCWPAAPSLPLDRPWTPPSSVSNKREPTALSTHFYFAKPFGMSATMQQWSIRETASTVNCRQEGDHLHRPRPAQVLHLPLSSTFWHGSTMHRCVTHMRSHSSKTAATMTATTSEVAVFTP